MSVPAVPNFTVDPTSTLQTIYSHPPSLEALSHLGGSVASSVKENNNPAVALLYVKAAARHLPALVESQQAARANRAAAVAAAAAASLVGPAGGGGAGAAAAAAAGGPQAFALPPQATNADAHRELQQTHMLHEISGALSFAATFCQPRAAIVETGILPVLERLLPSKTSVNHNNALIWPGASLTPLHADVLQIFLCAGRPHDAEQIVMDTWPRPSRGIGAVVVLRYFYLRGMVHMECQNWEWATRCFWTCLCIPAEATSALVVAAWKKLVLLQALSQSERPPAEMSVMKTPKTTPVCVSRFLNQAINSSSGGGKHAHLSGGGGDTSPIVAAPEDVTGVGIAPHPILLHTTEVAIANGALLPHVPGVNPSNQTAAKDTTGIRAYSDLVKAFVKVNRESFVQVLTANRNQFANDGNLPLVQLVENELVKRQIYQWSRVFSVISLERLGGLISMPVADLQNLLASFAELTQWKIEIKDQMAYFPKHEPVAAMTASPESHAQDLADLMLMMQKLDVAVSTSPKFLSLSRRDSASNEGKSTGPRGVEDV